MSKKGGPSIKNMHIAFAIASVILVLATVYAFIQDYGHDFTKYQKDYRDKELQRLKAERDVATADLSSPDYAKKLESVEAEIEKGKADLAQKQGDVDNAKRETAKIDDKLQLGKRQLNFLKADLQTKGYDVDAGKAKREDLVALQKAVDAKFAEVEKLKSDRDAAQKVIADANADLKNAQKEYDVLVGAQTDLNGKIKKAVGSPIINLAKDAPGINFIAPNYHIEQVVLQDIPEDRFFAKTMRVDRCVSCHKAIDNPDVTYQERDTAKLDAALRSHPRLDLFVSPNSKHPYNKFGCTVCHNGKPMGTTFTRAAHSPQNPAQAEEWEKKYGWEYLHYWDNKMLPLQHTEASCLKCHKGLDDVPEAHKLNEGRYLFRDRGCANCHMGASGDKDMAWVGRIGPDLRRIGEKTDKNWARNWIMNPWDFRPSTKMPRFFGLENRTDEDMNLAVGSDHMPRDPVEVEAIATYLFTTSKLREEAPAEPPVGDAEAGKQLFSSVGCLGCHSTLEAKEGEKFDINRHGPDLSRVGEKLSPGWLFNWLKSPRNYWAETKMPNLRLTDKEAADITAYLMNTMKAKKTQAPSDAPEDAFDQVLRDKLAATTPPEKLKEMLDDPVKLMDESLHNKVKMVGQAGKMIDSGEGEWSEAQIAKVKSILAAEKDPKRAAKAFYTGETLIQHHGCFGCHNIQGWTFAPLTCVNLAGEADKDLEKLDFGKTQNDKHPIGHTKWDWFYTKIARPRVYDIGKLELIKPFDRLRMPWFGYAKTPKEGDEAADPKLHALHPEDNPDIASNDTPYGLNERQIERLVTHILSLTMEPIPVEKQHAPSPQEQAIDRGHRVVRELNCTGCHLVGLNGSPEPGGEPLPSQIPLEALVTLLSDAGPDAAAELRKPGNGIYLDEDLVTLNYEEKAGEKGEKDEKKDPVSMPGFINALRGSYITGVTAPIILGEKRVRANSIDPFVNVGFRFEAKAKKGWVKYGDLVPEDHFLAVTKYFFGDEKTALSTYKKLAKRYVEKDAYERMAGTDALAHAPADGGEKLTALEVEDRKVKKTYYVPTMIKVRFQRGEGRIANHIIDFEKSKGVEQASQQQAPPSLSFEGGKVQPDWLYQFLHNVYPLRQGLDIRMPSFWTDGPYSKYKSIYPAGHLSAVDPLKRDNSIAGEPLPSAEAPKVSDLPDDAAQIADYFVYDAKEKTYGTQPGPLQNDGDKKMYTDGQFLIFGDEKAGGMGCVNCHGVGSKIPKEAKWAPNLANVKRRLRPDWVQRFLVYPAAIYPWTNMPNNFHFDWDNYKYSTNAADELKGIQENNEENVKTWAQKVKSAQYYLMHSGEAEIGGEGK